MANQQPTILVIIGVTGDLSRRKLLPAIAEIAAAGALPEQFKVIGISRRDISVDEVLAGVTLQAGQHDFLRTHLDMYQMDIDSEEDYTKLRGYLDTIQVQWGAPMQRLFYLSVPPQVSQPIVAHLGESGLSTLPDTKLLLEKPFGTDLASAEALIADTKRHFKEEQLYRIDHYLAKEMAQDIVIFRSGNSLFKRTWNNQFIERIEIVATENIGVEGRATFYEQTGALRDVVQSHLLQLAALTLMELPAHNDWGSIPAKRLEALRALQAPQPAELPQAVTRGQYRAYATEVNNPGSIVETFVSVTLFSGDPRWRDVPITLTTGKALNQKTTEIRVHYKKDAEQEANVLSLRIQPHEGIEILMWAKRPGYDRELERLPLHFTYKDHYMSLPEAYERVLIDAIRSDHSLFASSEEVLASWHLLAPIQHHWNMHTDDLILYDAGTPPEKIGA